MVPRERALGGYVGGDEVLRLSSEEPNQPMNDLDEFAEVALAIFVGLTLLVWLLTYLERIPDKRAGTNINSPTDSAHPTSQQSDGELHPGDS